MNNNSNVNMNDPQVQQWMIQEMELAMERLNVSLHEVQSWLTKKEIPSDPNKLTLYQCISNYAEMMYASNNHTSNPFLLPIFSTQTHKQPHQKHTTNIIKSEPIDLTNDNIKITQTPKHNNITNIALTPIHLPPLPNITLPNITPINHTQQPPLPLPNLLLSPSSPTSPISQHNITPLDVKMTDINDNKIPIDPVINSYLYAFPPSIQNQHTQHQNDKNSFIKKIKVNELKKPKNEHKHRRKHVRKRKHKVKKENVSKASNHVKSSAEIKTQTDKVRAIRSRGGGGIVKPMKDEFYRLISRVDIEGKLQYLKYSGVDLAHCFVKRTDKIIKTDPITGKEIPGIKVIVTEGHKCKTMNCKYPHLYSQKCHWKRHALTEHCNRKFECRFCGAAFRQQTQRKEHIINKHTQQIQKWLCPYGCGGVFSQFRGVVRHVKFDRKCDARDKYFGKEIIDKLKDKWDNESMKAILKFETKFDVEEQYMVTKEMQIKIRKKIKNMFFVVEKKLKIKN